MLETIFYVTRQDNLGRTSTVFDYLALAYEHYLSAVPAKGETIILEILVNDPNWSDAEWQAKAKFYLLERKTNA